MSSRHVPTLTEEVEVGASTGHRQDLGGAGQDGQEPWLVAQAAASVVAQAIELSAAAVASRMGPEMETRLMDALAPALAQAVAALLAGVRDELAGSLPELVRDAVAEELRRQSDKETHGRPKFP